MKNKAFIHEYDNKLFIRVQKKSGHWEDHKVDATDLYCFLVTQTDLSTEDIKGLTNGK